MALMVEENFHSQVVGRPRTIREGARERRPHLLIKDPSGALRFLPLRRVCVPFFAYRMNGRNPSRCRWGETVPPRSQRALPRPTFTAYPRGPRDRHAPRTAGPADVVCVYLSGDYSMYVLWGDDCNRCSRRRRVGGCPSIFPRAFFRAGWGSKCYMYFVVFIPVRSVSVDRPKQRAKTGEVAFNVSKGH